MNNPKKTARPVMPQAQMTDQEKKEAVARVISQKRETFAINILCNMVRVREDADIADVKRAVKMADTLIEELYPLPETPTDQS